MIISLRKIFDDPLLRNVIKDDPFFKKSNQGDNLFNDIFSEKSHQQ